MRTPLNANITMCKVEANTRAAEIICEAKQAIENFKNGTVETVSMDTFLQSLQQKYVALLQKY